MGALAIAQVIRLGSMLETPHILQMQLGSSQMVIQGRMNPAPCESVGASSWELGKAAMRIQVKP